MRHRVWTVATAALITLLLMPGSVWSWGSIGHLVSARMAEARLTPAALAAVRDTSFCDKQKLLSPAAVSGLSERTRQYSQNDQRDRKHESADQVSDDFGQKQCCEYDANPQEEIARESRLAAIKEVIMSLDMKRRISGICLGIGAFLWLAGAANAQKIVVDTASSHVANTFSPFRALGAAIDRLRTGTPEKLLTDPVLKEILGAGWQTVTYRQNTELMVEAWHWNARGAWSNPVKQEGYFTGSAERAAD